MGRWEAHEGLQGRDPRGTGLAGHLVSVLSPGAQQPHHRGPVFSNDRVQRGFRWWHLGGWPGPVRFCHGLPVPSLPPHLQQVAEVLQASLLPPVNCRESASGLRPAHCPSREVSVSVRVPDRCGHGALAHGGHGARRDVWCIAARVPHLRWPLPQEQPLAPRKNMPPSTTLRGPLAPVPGSVVWAQPSALGSWPLWTRPPGGSGPSGWQ